MTEEQMMKLLGLWPDWAEGQTELFEQEYERCRNTMDRLRNSQGLPFVPVTRQVRVYLLEEVMVWLKNRQVVKGDAGAASD